MSVQSTKVVDDETAMGNALAELRDARSTDTVSPASTPDVIPQAATNTAVTAAALPDADKPNADAQAPATETKTPEQELTEKKAELHRVTSEIGRVNALNRKNQESTLEIVRLREQLAVAQRPPETQAEARTKLEELSEQVKDFPELLSIVTAVNERLKEVEGNALTTATKAAQEAMKPLEPLRLQHQDQQDQRIEAAHAADMTVFSESYPEAVQIIKTNDFRAWLPKQPQAIQFSFHKGETAAEALAVMDAYDAHLRRTGQPSIAHIPQSLQTPPAAEPSKTNNRLMRATGIPSRSTSGNKSGMPAEDDFEGSLEFFRRQRLQQQAARA